MIEYQTIVSTETERQPTFWDRITDLFAPQNKGITLGPQLPMNKQVTRTIKDNHGKLIAYHYTYLENLEGTDRIREDSPTNIMFTVYFDNIQNLSRFKQELISKGYPPRGEKTKILEAMAA